MQFLHTMIRTTDPARSRRFYEAVGFRFSREVEIVRNDELEATISFYSTDDAEDILELTYNHDGRTYDVGTSFGHVAVGVEDLDETLAGLEGHGIAPESPPYQVLEGGSFIAFVRDPDGHRVELTGPPVAS
ncbi:MAG: Glyoxalase/bleomycin resistance protein/dioxygenase [Conexibacter sp.]|jgi:lactoylglutathione lyase|nr:Glyoxalase/bleomycin resistance protein/dioxygenase [Conexibacter sp.]